MAREWRDCADVEFQAMDGAHFEFTRCPAALRDLIAARVGGT